MDVKPHKLNFNDYKAIAKLHCNHINQGFLATLGVPFLTFLYESIDKDNASTLLVERKGDLVVAYVAAGCGLGPIYKQLLLNPIRLIYSLKNCILSPSKIYKIIELFFMSKNYKLSADLPRQELLSIVVDSSYQGNDYAKNLFEALCSKLRKRGESSFKIVVGNNLERAHAFYKKMGSIPMTEIEVHKGQSSTIYVMQLSSVMKNNK